MAMEIFSSDLYPQGSEQWRKIRMGIPTSSEFATVMAKGKGGGVSLTRKKYMLQLAGERLTEEPMESYSNSYMERGKEMEEEARNYYALMTDTELALVGFIRSSNAAGCSPDAVIAPNGMLELKTQAPHLLIERLLSGEPPPEHIAQLQGNLWVAEREWIDLAIYFRKMPMFKMRFVRDEPYIKTLAVAVKQFNDELDETVERIRRLQ
jgi:hypothetical protein